VFKVIGASPNAVRMQKVVGFYEKLPRGPAPEPQAKGLLGRYQKKHMGKNPSGRRAYIYPEALCWVLRPVLNSKSCGT
jgi:hypothetical protein